LAFRFGNGLVLGSDSADRRCSSGQRRSGERPHEWISRALEAGRRLPRETELSQLARAYQNDFSDVFPARQPVELDSAARWLRMGAAEWPLGDSADRQEVYGAYVALLSAVRGAQRGERMSLRSSDIQVLLAAFGDDPERLERRLVELMGCSPEEASLLRRVLLRHRALTASVAVITGLSLASLAGVQTGADLPTARADLGSVARHAPGRGHW
jgi:hypothetical protein